MDNLNNLRSRFNNEWNKTGIYHAKNLIKNLPTWEEIIKILNKEITKKGEPEFFTSDDMVQDYEIVYKDIIAMKKLYFNKDKLTVKLKEEFDNGIESNATFFFSLFFKKERFNQIVSESLVNEIKNMNEIFDIDTHFISLKIALADKVVPFESHEKNTCVVQLAGTNVWNLRDKKNGLETSYIVQAGDCLFFKENIEHELTNEEPRSSIVGRFEFGKSYE
jgi:hypothetical protein